MADTSSAPAVSTISAGALKRSLSPVDAWFFLGASMIVIAVVVGSFLK